LQTGINPMKKICYLIVLLPFCLSAQSNESDTLKWKASLGLTGFYQQGNVETAIFRAKAEMGYPLGINGSSKPKTPTSTKSLATKKPMRTS